MTYTVTGNDKLRRHKRVQYSHFNINSLTGIHVSTFSRILNYLESLLKFDFIN